MPSPEALTEDIYAPAVTTRPTAHPGPAADRSYREALTEALREELARDPRVVLFGEDVGRAGGAFKVTEGLQAEFGENRVRDTPIAENTLVGMVLGAALTGLRPVCEIMFVDLMALTMDQVVNFGAKIRYDRRAGEAAPRHPHRQRRRHPLRGPALPERGELGDGPRQTSRPPSR